MGRMVIRLGKVHPAVFGQTHMHGIDLRVLVPDAHVGGPAFEPGVGKVATDHHVAEPCVGHLVQVDDVDEPPELSMCPLVDHQRVVPRYEGDVSIAPPIPGTATWKYLGYG